MNAPFFFLNGVGGLAGGAQGGQFSAEAGFFTACGIFVEDTGLAAFIQSGAEGAEGRGGFLFVAGLDGCVVLFLQRLDAALLALV
ncbi:MAG: hypothetical protein RI897_2393 [Verrucomicrobiota bacterium]